MKAQTLINNILDATRPGAWIPAEALQFIAQNTKELQALLVGEAQPGRPSMLEVLKLAQATINRLSVQHGPFNSSQGTLDVIAAAIEGLQAAPQVDTLKVCSDCLQVVAYGVEEQNDLDADREGEILVAIQKRLAHGGTLHAGERCDEFSARRCELCGSTLGGERHTVTHIGGHHEE